MKPDTRLHPSQLPAPTHNGRDMVDGEVAHAADMITRWSQRWKLPEDEIKEFVADVQESFSETDTAEETLAAVRKVLDLENRAVAACHIYVKMGGDQWTAERCMWLLMGRHENAGVSNLADLVKLIERRGFGKAAVNKALQHFQKQVPELPILPGQREMESKLKMKNSRKQQSCLKS